MVKLHSELHSYDGWESPHQNIIRCFHRLSLATSLPQAHVVHYATHPAIEEYAACCRRQKARPGAGDGLQREILSPLETLAQSVSTMAPTTTPAATIPVVCALARNGTWLAYVLATVAVLLVALCSARFARYWASPGSLYT
jgi:hypothetical protein